MQSAKYPCPSTTHKAPRQPCGPQWHLLAPPPLEATRPARLPPTRRAGPPLVGVRRQSVRGTQFCSYGVDPARVGADNLGARAHPHETCWAAAGRREGSTTFVETGVQCASDDVDLALRAVPLDQAASRTALV